MQNVINFISWTRISTFSQQTWLLLVMSLENAFINKILNGEAILGQMEPHHIG
jgi:hypothetical protein